MTGRDLELRDLFDPDDFVDRWVFMLSATISDLAISEATFKDALHDPGCPLAHRFYLHRQLAGRVIEAWRVVGAIRDHEEIATFVNSAGGAMRRSGCWKSSRGRPPAKRPRSSGSSAKIEKVPSITPTSTATS